MPVRVQTADFDAGHEVSALRGADARVGAVATFIGVVRDHNLNRRVTHLEYDAYEPLAVKALEQICEEAVRECRAGRRPAASCG